MGLSSNMYKGTRCTAKATTVCMCVVMMVIGFTRVGGPSGFCTEHTSVFPHWLVRGVPDGIDVSYVGAQYDYDRTNPWTDDDAPGCVPVIQIMRLER